MIFVKCCFSTRETVSVPKMNNFNMADSTPSRHEKSLGLLTTKFVTLLKEAQDGVLDLKVAADMLAVRQKRRIYDITNVLEGIGLIEKKSKNSIQWKGAGPGTNSADISGRLMTLQQEIKLLEAKEQELDKHKQWVQQSITNVTDDKANNELAYVTHEDLCKSFKDDTLLAIQAPSGTQLEVPIPEMPGPNNKRKYQIHLKSHSGAIYVLLVNIDNDTSSPVVVQVPPPDDSAMETSQNQNPHPVTRRQVLKTEPKSPAKTPLRPSQQSSLDPTTTTANIRPATRSSPRKQDPSLLPPQENDLLKDIMNADTNLFNPVPDSEFMDDLMSSEIFAPLLRLSPPPSDKDYYYNLDDTEGVCDLFDVQFG